MEPSYKLAVFEGPLDLLLHLVQKNKVDIYDIPVAEILRQYLAFMEEMERADLELATEFTVMASTLLYMKTRMLLPKADEEEEDPRKPLADALAEYRRFKRSVGFFADALPKGQDRFVKRPEPSLSEKREIRPEDYRHRPEELARALRSVLLRSERKKPVSKTSFSGILKRENVSVEEKSELILTLIRRWGSVGLEKLVFAEKNRAHAVASFLAVLDLCRQGVVFVEDDGGPLLRMADRNGAEVQPEGEPVGAAVR